MSAPEVTPAGGPTDGEGTTVTERTDYTIERNVQAAQVQEALAHTRAAARVLLPALLRATVLEKVDGWQDNEKRAQNTVKAQFAALGSVIDNLTGALLDLEDKRK